MIAGSADVGRTLRDWRAYLPLARGIAAFLFIYGFYAFASAYVVPILLELRADPKVVTEAYRMRAEELTTTIYWAALALLAGAVAIGVVVSSIVQLRRNLEWTSFRAAISFLTAMSFLAVVLAFNNPVGILKFPQLLTCADEPVVEVVRPFACGRVLSVKVGEAISWKGADWLGVVLRLKLFLNILLSTAAIFVIGAMLIISSTSKMARRPLRFYARMNRNGVLMHLFVAGAVTLSLTTLTDVLLVNWPTHSVQAQGTPATPHPKLVGIMAAFTSYYAVLGSIVLGMAIFFSREFSFRKVSILTPQGSTALSRFASRAGDFVFRDGTIKALVALSPVLTVFVGHPLVEDVIKALAKP